ncbi:HEAT repeat domain-containing protein [Anabaena minutissima FACHB-250]|nr:HEAT repeat domain-containing protein [Anabaena minutissima FACHB-250]
MINWNDYLQSLCNDYAQWWNAYTLTDVVGQQRVEQKHSPLLLDFMVQTVQSGKEEKSASQQVERLDVLAGLRKYAQEHVLLVGRPGSGKSTALARLLLEEAEKPLPQPLPEAERGANSPPSLPKVDRGVNSPPSLPSARCANAGKGVGGLGQIPILVELRYYQTSVLDLIRDFLMRHRLLLETATIEKLLFDGEFLLLVDGINELPSEAARQDLSKFRQDYQKTTPMIFTTRDLGLGGDLGITKKLEMQPLTAEQMQQFVRAYLPQQGEQMLQNLGDRLRELGETPLLLLMLCSLFKRTGDIPPNLGLVFRQFTQSYERQFRQDIPVTDESRRWWFSLLKHLAFYMTTGDKLTELNVAIPKSKAEDVLTQFLLAEKFDRPRDRALAWLKDLLNHHLIQLGANDQIEFRHQLIQEYYTAECLLTQLPSLSDDCLQREYLNYLKWTEPLKLMLELVDNGAQAVQVVGLALKVDWQLGAKLAGAVKPELQQQTVDLVAQLQIPLLFKISLLGLTKSDKAIPYLNPLLEDEDSDVRRRAAYALGEIKSEAAIPRLIQLLEDEDSDVRAGAADALGGIKSEAAIPGLIQLLEHGNSDVRRSIASALGEIKSEAAIPHLIKLIEDEDSFVRYSAASALREIKSEAAIPGLIQLLEHGNSDVRISAASTLKEIKSESAIPGLIQLLEHGNSDVRRIASSALEKIKWEAAIFRLIQLLEHGNSDVRRSAAYALEKIKWEAAIPRLIQLLEDEDFKVRISAASALGEIKSEAAIPRLIQLLEDEDFEVRINAASALGKIKSEAAIPGLIQLLEHGNSDVRRSAASVLGKIKSEAAIPGLIQLLEDEDFEVRYIAASALGEIKSEAAIPGLIQLLEHVNSDVRISAASALGEIKSEAAIPRLIQLLENGNTDVRISAASALGKIKSEAAIPELIKLLEHGNYYLGRTAASALGKIKSEAAIPRLIQLLEYGNTDVRISAAYALREIKSEAAIPGLIQLLEHEKLNVRRSVADTLGSIKSDVAIPKLIQLLEHKLSHVRYSAAYALGEIKSEAAVPGLIQLLEHEKFDVRRLAADTLGKIKSEAAIHGLIRFLENGYYDIHYNVVFAICNVVYAIKNIKSEAVFYSLIHMLKHEELDVRRIVAYTFRKIKLKEAIPGLIELLEDEDYDVRYNATLALAEIKPDVAIINLIKLLEDKDSNVRDIAVSALLGVKSEAAIPQVMNLLKNEEFVAVNNGEMLRYVLKILEAIQENCQYYNCLTEPKTLLSLPPSQPIKTSLMYILHLSDLHFGTPDQSKLWSNQLASDLQNELEIPHLDALILSGDIANKSTPAEYQAAQQFFDELRQDFSLQHEQIIIVPGNHDLNWQLAKKAYQLIDRDEYEGELKQGEYIEESPSVIRVRDEEKYKQRFEHFSNFYETIKNKPYPLDSDEQYTLDHFPNQNLLILGLNSAWKLDHYDKISADINMNALTNALKEIRRNQEYQNCIKIAVWHHPLDSAWEDRIKNQSFMEQLAVAGFRFFLHGHVHKAETSLYRYDMSANGRKLDRICAGTFGAPTHELNSGYPWQYNLLKFADNKLTVYTRRREELNGAWKPDARWLMGAGQNPLPYYEVQL